jgi:cytochrome c-type biogenesis protein CcmH/NrfF
MMNRSRKTDKRADNPKKRVTIQINQTVFYGTLAILGSVAIVLVGIWLFRLLTTASQPQVQPTVSVRQTSQTFPTPPSVAYSAEAKELFASLKCLCGTCDDTLAKCNCGQARQMKGYVDSLVESGISTSEVMDKVVEKYGLEVLASEE